MKKQLLQVLFWSVISAAFIGPGTVTTAASAGVSFRYALLWALLFSTIATYTLQEASARLTIVSGKNLGQALRHRFQGKKIGIVIIAMALGAILIGNAAYEAGNILGGVAGAMLASPISRQKMTLLIGFLAALMLFLGNSKTVAKLLGAVVAMMGIAFLLTAISLRPPIKMLVAGLFTPTAPPNSGILILGLIGTTVVPYNLFLGSGIAKGQKLEEFRFGLFVAVFLGGLISMCILVVGAFGPTPFSFEGLAETLSSQLGDWARDFFAFGLFAAGFSSAITAPLAAAITAQSLLGQSDPPKWRESGWRFRSVWLIILTTGVLFGLADIRPIPAIILAQALNGMLLPLIAVFLFMTVNDYKIIGPAGRNSDVANMGMGIIVAMAILLGITNLLKAVGKAFGYPIPPATLLWMATAITLLISIWVISVILQTRSRSSKNITRH